MSKRIMVIDLESDVLNEIKDLLKRRGYDTAISDSEENNIDKKIARIFLSIGIPANLKGYTCLREAIKLTVKNHDIVNNATKRLYPEVAKLLETSPNKVERAIRTAIDVACSRGKMENLNTLFGVQVYNRNYKPSNTELIALIAEHLIFEGFD